MITETSPRIQEYSAQILFSILTFSYTNKEILAKQISVRLMIRRLILQMKSLDFETWELVSNIHDIECHKLLHFQESDSFS